MLKKWQAPSNTLQIPIKMDRKFALLYFIRARLLIEQMANVRNRSLAAIASRIVPNGENGVGSGCFPIFVIPPIRSPSLPRGENGPRIKSNEPRVSLEGDEERSILPVPQTWGGGSAKRWRRGQWRDVSAPPPPLRGGPPPHGFATGRITWPQPAGCHFDRTNAEFPRTNRHAILTLRC